MNLESTEKMRFDRRLVLRRGWVSRDQLAAALEALPDVAGKAITVGDAEEAGSPPGGGSETPQTQ